MQHSKASKTATAAVVGARGYAGLELAKLLFRHPAVELTHAYASNAFHLKDELFDSRAKHVVCATEASLEENQTDLVFLATPAEVSMKWAPRLIAKGQKVIDLSGAFRLNEDEYPSWYGFKHEQPELLATADYGLCPYAGPVSVGTSLIANPGCYATAINLALIPLLKHGLIEESSLVIDAKSGTTGAGRKASDGQLFAEVDGECLPYKVGRHQHLPEIQAYAKKFGGAEIDPHFVTHLLPVRSGIIAGVYAQAKTTDLSEIAKAYDAEYGNYPLVHHGTKIAQLASLKKVVGTAETHISYEIVGRKLYAFAAIDNLMKGAASQAIENMNRWMDLPLSKSLREEV